MTALPATRPGANIAAPPSTEGRYLDALLSEMDRYIAPEIGTERARFLYQGVRRVLSRLIAEAAHRPPLAETGIVDAPDWASMDPNTALQLEGALLDSTLAWGDARSVRIDSAADAAPLSQDDLQNALSALGYPEATVENMRIIVGGRSKQTILLRATHCGPLPPDLVMRRDLLVGSLGTSVVNEFELLRTLDDHHVRVPKVYHLQPDRAALGTPFLLLQALPGEATGQITVAPPHPARIREAARALASVHRVPVAATAPLLAHLGAPKNRADMAAEIDSWRTTWTAQTRQPSPAIEAAFAYLTTHVQTIEESPCFVHGDYSFHNLLFSGDKLTAVLDWELSHIGHAAEDLGYIKHAAQTVIPWAEFMAEYHAAGGPPITQQALHFYGLLGTLRLLMKIFIARKLFEEGKTDDILKADVAAFWMPRVIRKISLEMREIAEKQALLF